MSRGLQNNIRRALRAHESRRFEIRALRDCSLIRRIRVPYYVVDSPVRRPFCSTRLSRECAVGGAAFLPLPARVMSAADALTQDDWVPAQEVFESGADFRFAESARMCRKRMREIEERDANGEEDMEEEIDEHECERLRKAARPTYEQVVGKASGRAWKPRAEKRAASFMKPQTGVMKTWAQKMEEKAKKKAFATEMRSRQDDARAARKKEHERLAAKKKQKQENVMKTGLGNFKDQVTTQATVAKRSRKNDKRVKKQKALKMT